MLVSGLAALPYLPDAVTSRSASEAKAAQGPALKRPVTSEPVHQIDLLGAGEITLSADGIGAISARRAFSPNPSITQRDVIHRHDLLPIVEQAL